MRPLDKASGRWVSFRGGESEVRFHPDDSFPEFILRRARIEVS